MALMPSPSCTPSVVDEDETCGGQSSPDWEREHTITALEFLDADWKSGNFPKYYNLNPFLVENRPCASRACPTPITPTLKAWRFVE